MKRLCIYLLAMALCVLCQAVALADPLTAVIQKKYDGIGSMKAEFTQILVHKESGSRETRSGTLSFKKPLLVRWENKGTSPELLVVTKTEIWNVFPDEDVAYKYPLSMVRDKNSIVRVVTGQARLEQDFTFKNEGSEGGLTRLRLYPKEPVQALVEAIFWVEPSTGLIRRLRIYDFYGNENEITFTKQTIGASVSDSVFTFTPPRGMDVEDRTGKDGVLQKPLMQ